MFVFHHILLDVEDVVVLGHVHGVLLVDGGGVHELCLLVEFVLLEVPVLMFPETQPEDNAPVSQVCRLE